MIKYYHVVHHVSGGVEGVGGVEGGGGGAGVVAEKNTKRSRRRFL